MTTPAIVKKADLKLMMAAVRESVLEYNKHG